MDEKVLKQISEDKDIQGMVALGQLKPVPYKVLIEHPINQQGTLAVEVDDPNEKKAVCYALLETIVQSIHNLSQSTGISSEIIASFAAAMVSVRERKNEKE